MKTYLEYQDDKSHKFWEIEVKENTHTVRYGKLGTNGTSKTKEFADEELAKKDATKLIATKTKKGYDEVSYKKENKGTSEENKITYNVKTLKKCTLQQKWTPEFHETEIINGIHFTDALRRELCPRVDGVKMPIRPLPTLEEAWSAIYNGLWKADAEYLKEHTDERSRIWKALEDFEEKNRIIGERVSNELPTTDVSFEDEIALAEKIFESHQQMTYRYNTTIYNALTDYFVVLYGIQKTIEILLLALYKLDYVGIKSFARLRELISLESVKTYYKLRDESYKVYTKRYDDRIEHHTFYNGENQLAAHLSWAMSFIFPISSISGEIEEEVHKRALKVVTQDYGNCDVHASGLASGNLATFKHFVKKDPSMGHPFLLGTCVSYVAPLDMYLVTLMEYEGKNMLEDLMKMCQNFSYLYDYEYSFVYRWCHLLAHFDDDRAIKKLFEIKTRTYLSAEALKRVKTNLNWGTDALLKASQFQKDRVLRCAKEVGDDEFIKLLESLNSDDIDKIITDKLSRKDNNINCSFKSPNIIIPKFIIEPPAFSPIKQELERVPSKQYFKLKPEFIWKEEYLLYAKEQYKGRILKWNNIEINKLSSSQLDDYITHCEKYVIPSSISELLYMDKKSAVRRMKVGTKHDYANLFYLVKLLEEEAIDIIIKGLNSKDKDSYYTVLPVIGSLKVAPIMILNFAAKKYKTEARKWIKRYPKYAIASAITMIIDGLRKEVLAASRVIIFLKGQGHEKEILKFAKKLKEDKILEKIEGILNTDPLYLPKVKLPKIPSYISFAKLPKLLDKSKKELSKDEVNNYLLELAFSLPDEPHPNVLLAKKVLDKKSMAEFSWRIFELWLEKDADSTENWCMQSVGFWGDDKSVVKIARLMKDWPGDGFSVRAQSGLDVLLNIGTDSALVNINLLAEKSRYDGFKWAAKERINTLAEELNLTSDELSDRLVPTFDFENNGDVLDFGSRKFYVQFDKELKPYIIDENSQIIKTLPRPNKTDNKDLAKEAKETLSNIKKLSKQSAELQLIRLEKMMQSQRTVNKGSFTKNFANHPWMKFISKNLIWLDITTNTYFKIDEKGTFIDKDAKELKLNAKSQITIAHIINMPKDELEKWGEYFFENDIEQPFNQLNRELFYPTEEEKNKDELYRFTGIPFEPQSISRLAKNGWHKYIDVGVHGIDKQITNGFWFIIMFDPGWHQSEALVDVDKQKVDHISICGKRKNQLSELEFSEMIYEVKKALY